VDAVSVSAQNPRGRRGILLFLENHHLLTGVFGSCCLPLFLFAHDVMEFPVTAIMISPPGVWAPALIPTQDSFPPFLPRNKSHRLDMDSLLMLTIADWEFAFTSPASARPGYPSAIIPLGACRPRLPRLHPRLRLGMTRE
jgi:hypothetical protein